MTTSDFRAELERLLYLYEALGGNWTPHNYTDTWNDALASARAALATSPPEPPTDEELDEFAIYWWGPDTDERTVSVSDAIECCNMGSFARAVLKRWGK